MAKALFGHIGTPADSRLASEVRRLRDRVRHLEAEVAVLQAENSSLLERRLTDSDILSLSESTLAESLNELEPAYT